MQAATSSAAPSGWPLLRPVLALAAAVAAHGVLVIVLAFYQSRVSLLVPQAPPLEVAVIEKPKPPPPPPPPPPPKPKPVKMKLARAPQKPPPAPLPPPPENRPPPPPDVPPPPTTEAKNVTQNVQTLTGFKLESTVNSGTWAAPVGNTMYGTPSRTAPDPATVKPYKAERYAPAVQLQELPSVLNRDAVDIRKFYPPDALKREFEGEVVLRLLIDSDGSLAKVDVISDPGQGLGQAAVRAIREFRFSPGKLNGTAVATTVPFTIRFVIN